MTNPVFEVILLVLDISNIVRFYVFTQSLPYEQNVIQGQFSK